MILHRTFAAGVRMLTPRQAVEKLEALREEAQQFANREIEPSQVLNITEVSSLTGAGGFVSVTVWYRDR